MLPLPLLCRVCEQGKQAYTFIAEAALHLVSNYAEHKLLVLTTVGMALLFTMHMALAVSLSTETHTKDLQSHSCYRIIVSG